MDVDVHLILAERARVGISPDPSALIDGSADGYAGNADIPGINRARIDTDTGVVEPLNIDVAGIDIREASGSRIMKLRIGPIDFENKGPTGSVQRIMRIDDGDCEFEGPRLRWRAANLACGTVERKAGRQDNVLHGLLYFFGREHIGVDADIVDQTFPSSIGSLVFSALADNQFRTTGYCAGIVRAVPPRRRILHPVDVESYEATIAPCHRNMLPLGRLKIAGAFQLLFAARG